jgi:hypothetical protein
VEPQRARQMSQEEQSASSRSHAHVEEEEERDQQAARARTRLAAILGVYGCWFSFSYSYFVYGMVSTAR